MDIVWRRTALGGEILSRDFVAESDGMTIGRIKLVDGGPRQGQWHWAFLATRPGRFNRRHTCQGVADSRDGAVEQIRCIYAFWMGEAELDRQEAAEMMGLAKYSYDTE